MMTLQDHLARLDEIESMKAAQNYKIKMPDFSQDYREMYREAKARERVYGKSGQ